jgi:hypothetical protein
MADKKINLDDSPANVDWIRTLASSREDDSNTPQETGAP